YYPGTSTAGLPGSTVFRVGITDATALTCVAALPGLNGVGIGALTSTGVARYRLVPSGAGLALQKGTQPTCGGNAWTTVRGGLGSRIDFNSSAGYVRLYLSDGTSTDYRGLTGAVRAGSGEVTVNRVNAEEYTAGVVPREMPTSWGAQALYAQAIAVRTYAAQALQNPVSPYYDICATTQCQVYGGMTHYDASGAVLWQDDTAVVSGNQGKILTYGGVPAFTQYSASNGGYVSAGGQPYLVAKSDPYDNAASGDPYLSYTVPVSVQSLAASFGMTAVTQIQITQRDGTGTWGGRVVSAVVSGRNSQGQATSVSTDGWTLASAFGLGTTLYTLPSPPPPTCSPATLTNGGFTAASPLSGWTSSGLQLASASRPALPTGSGTLVNGQATTAMGSLSQSVTPNCAIAAGQRYVGSIWLAQQTGRPPAQMTLYLREYNAGGTQVGVASTQVTVPADGAWHNYATALTTAAGTSIRYQLYYDNPQVNISLTGARLAGNQLVNTGFASTPLTSWQVYQATATVLPRTRSAGQTLRLAGTTAHGSLYQDVVPAGGSVTQGVYESGQIWARVPAGSPVADGKLVLIGLDASGHVLWSSGQAFSVPADTLWRSYTVGVLTPVPTARLRFQYYLGPVGQQVDLDSPSLN
ncbi:MAG: SpoIID/LytB domain-containing protein, partial [Actinobacteria bacterium]|nr:SpoIID/LytB domain-containing protein [Actinomycetota bacterium]